MEAELVVDVRDVKVSLVLSVDKSALDKNSASLSYSIRQFIETNVEQPLLEHLVKVYPKLLKFLEEQCHVHVLLLTLSGINGPDSFSVY